jgi:hypothetical protein
MIQRYLPIAALLVLLPIVAMAAGTAAIAPPTPFTATYQVLRKGSKLGTGHMRLRHHADGTWAYQSKIQAESGLAALLGGNIRETSRFRWHDGHIEALSYDYRLHTSIKSRQRKVRVNWKANRVTVKTGGDTYTYKPQPGLIERHVLVLALGQALAAGKTHVALPVAVKDRVETQTFAVKGHQTVKVPAGSIRAIRVERTDKDKNYAAWFAPKRYGDAPVKIAGEQITLLLKSYRKS